MIRRWLLGLVGVRNDLIDELPGERFRYVAMAGVLLTTAVIASVSATFALQMALRTPLFWAALLGIGWGIVILNLDRLLVLGMTHRTGWWRNLLAALPRLALAVLLGTVISTPLVLRIFDQEISDKIPVLQTQSITDFRKLIDADPKYSQMDKMKAQLQADEDTANVAERLVEANQAVKDAQSRADTARTNFNNLQNAATLEANGHGGTGDKGYGPQALKAQQLADQAWDELTAADAAVDDAKAKVRTETQAKAPAARAEADQLQKQLTNLDQERDKRIADSYKASSNDRGLLIRLEALGALSKDRPDLARAQLVLFLLFLTIEILPVFVKLLHLSGRPTIYDVVSERQEESTKRTLLRTLARRETHRDAQESERSQQQFAPFDARARRRTTPTRPTPPRPTPPPTPDNPPANGSTSHPSPGTPINADSPTTPLRSSWLHWEQPDQK